MSTKRQTLAESLNEYFKNTPKEQIEKDWAQFDYLDNVGPTVREFIDSIRIQKATNKKDYTGILLEVGESYKDGFGSVVTIKKKDRKLFVGDNGEYYTSRGKVHKSKYIKRNIDVKMNLVSQV